MVDENRNVSRIRAEIFRVAKKRGVRSEELIKAHVRERFLYYISKSSLIDSITLKGGQLIQAWGQGRSGSYARPTKDLDLSIQDHNPGSIVDSIQDQSPDSIIDSIREALQIAEGDDGVRFDAGSIEFQYITGGNTFRVRIPAFLGKTPAPIWLDIGLTDETFPEATIENLPRVIPGLGLAPVVISCYPKEAVLSEKYHAMVSWGEESSRLKDYYDIWLLAGMFEFEGRVLQKSIQKTFENRMTKIQSPDELFTENLILKCAPRWSEFELKLNLNLAFQGVLTVISRFIGPVCTASREGITFNLHWRVNRAIASKLFC